MGECENEPRAAADVVIDPGPADEEAWQLFLASFSKGGIVTDAALAAGKDPRTIYRWRERSERCMSEFKEAERQAADVLRKEARRRAVDGVSEPVFFQGEICGYVQRYSDSLMGRLLVAHCEEHKQESTLKLKGDRKEPVTIDFSDLSSDQIRRILALEEEVAEILAGESGSQE